VAVGTLTTGSAGNCVSAFFERTADLRVRTALRGSERALDVRPRQSLALERRIDQCLVSGRRCLREYLAAALRPSFEQQHHGGRVVVHRGHHERTELVKRVHHVDVRAALQQELDHLDMALVGGKEERCRLVAVTGVDVGAAIQRLGDACDVTRSCSIPELFVERGLIGSLRRESDQ
jgi:hypothetical protein